MITIVKTAHHKNRDGKYAVMNYHCITEDTISNALYEETERFAVEKSLKYDGVPVNICLYKTREAANVENYQTLTGEQYLEYAEDHILCYVDDMFLDYPMKDELYEHIEVNIATVKDKTVRKILDELYAQRLEEEKEEDRLRILNVFLEDAGQA